MSVPVGAWDIVSIQRSAGACCQPPAGSPWSGSRAGARCAHCGRHNHSTGTCRSLTGQERDIERAGCRRPGLLCRGGVASTRRNGNFPGFSSVTKFAVADGSMTKLTSSFGASATSPASGWPTGAVSESSQRGRPCRIRPLPRRPRRWPPRVSCVGSSGSSRLGPRHRQRRSRRLRPVTGSPGRVSCASAVRAPA